MATNKNALIRYRTLDRCLQNRSRRWTLKDLIDACSDALYELEGKDSYVSKRTVQLDIQLLRSDKLGYNAPIEVYDRKYYRYSDPNFSITDVPLTEMDLDILSESVEMLKQFKSVSLFSELNGVIQKLEDKIYRTSKRQSPIIHLDKNEALKGLEHLDNLYQAILKEIVLRINYQSFKARSAGVIHLVPYILKEFNNRWFLVGRKMESEVLLTLALDRIVEIKYDLESVYDQRGFDADSYYKNTFGVTVLNTKTITPIELKVNRATTPYILTKPIHHSQVVVGNFPDGGVLIQLKVHQNFEIERLILGYSGEIEVIAPKRFRDRIRKKIARALALYSIDS